MKKARSLSFILLLSATGIQCGKDGATGGQGPAGPQGEQGIAGPAGLPGSKILNGTTVPAANLGAAGDYYVNLSTAQLYGPKTAADWGAAVALRGPAGATGATGANGTNGARILSGIAPPPPASGVNGDFYFDKLAAVMYGPKSDAGWGDGVPLRISRVISYVVTRPAELAWNASHLLDISNTLLPVPADIRTNGVVLTYIVIRGTSTIDTWHQIPGHIFLANPAVNYYFVGVRVAPSYIRIAAYNEDGSDLPAGTNPPNVTKLRVLLIPADEVNFISRKSVPVDLKNYDAVKAAFGISDDDAVTIE
ncbi:hypothetical protein [Chitinophaga barathri]|uniref:Collagen-like protein n=2 Tax=Chitinophaga barathri TaxID=1647451 RepID=A0A3N4MF23_9BACT|nr:hypothetical protein [Chitinophaga barathri]RPD38690.1 hypothetical protein EG028_23565 [Chitinophaga barathri]